MGKDENPASSDGCFSDIWTAAQHARSDVFRAIIAKTWRQMLHPAARVELERPHPLPSDPRGKVGV